MTIAAVTGVKPDDAGLASGLINTSQQVGGALGLAILAAVANGVTSDATGAPLARLTEGFQAAFYVGAGFAVIGALATTVFIRSSDSKAHRDAALAGEAQPVAA
jgi:sugar phosphate permease